VLGACRKLEDDGIPAPSGGKRWATSALTRIIEREAPELLPRKTLTNRRQPASADFAHLLRCPFCHVMLTPNTKKEQYYCRNGARDRTAHPRYVVREQDLRPFLEDEAARYRPPKETITTEGIEARVAAIEDRRNKAWEAYLNGKPENKARDKARYEAEEARADRELAELEGRTSVLAMHPEIDWNVPPDVVNGALRTIWREVRLDENLRPVEVEWVFPELRA
jgi:hypothetical protein